jgi:hypothetical protein
MRTRGLRRFGLTLSPLPNHQVMELSEHLKLRIEQPAIDNQPKKAPRPPDLATDGDSGPIDEAESQMRKALGLLGDGPRHRSDPDRTEQPNRMGDRFNGGLHRRRFVQDGDIPVTVLRRDQGHELPAHRGAPAATAPTSSRLQRVEAALASESAARERIERSLAETQAVAHDLQTKIGHAELAKIEALDALRREREAGSQLRADAHAWEAKLQEVFSQLRAAEQVTALCQEQLADERQGRRTAEKALRTAETAREAAEQLVRTLSEEAPRRSEPPRRPRVEPEVAAPLLPRRQRVPELPAVEPEPVKWWLTAKPAAKRR